MLKHTLLAYLYLNCALLSMVVGLCYDEYEEQELTDACEIIEWLANSARCNGRVGMYGKSWGGFNGLQVWSMLPKHYTVEPPFNEHPRDQGFLFAEMGSVHSPGVLKITAY